MVISRYLQHINTYLFWTTDRIFRTVIMQNSRLIQACFLIKIEEVWIDRFYVRYDWWPLSVPSGIYIHTCLLYINSKMDQVWPDCDGCQACAWGPLLTSLNTLATEVQTSVSSKITLSSDLVCRQRLSNVWCQCFMPILPVLYFNECIILYPYFVSPLSATMYIIRIFIPQCIFYKIRASYFLFIRNVHAWIGRIAIKWNKVKNRLNY